MIKSNDGSPYRLNGPESHGAQPWDFDQVEYVNWEYFGRWMSSPDLLSDMPCLEQERMVLPGSPSPPTPTPPVPNIWQHIAPQQPANEQITEDSSVPTVEPEVPDGTPTTEISEVTTQAGPHPRYRVIYYYQLLRSGELDTLYDERRHATVREHPVSLKTLSQLSKGEFVVVANPFVNHSLGPPQVGALVLDPECQQWFEVVDLEFRSDGHLAMATKVHVET